MPGYASNPGTAETMFADAEMPSPESKNEPAEPKEKERDGVTAMLPKTILAGKKFDVGDEVVLKIVAFHDDQVEVAYSYGDEGKEKGGDYEEEPSSDTGGAMADLMY